jgi:hypothetical protein
MNLSYLISGVVIMVMCSFACSNGIKESDRNIRTVDNTGPARTQPERHGAVDTLSVKILPESPTAMTALQAVCDYRGGSNVTYRWEHNNQVIPNEIGSSLVVMNRFPKGSRIAVIVTVDGQSAASSVVIGNTPPVISSVTLTPDIIHRGIDITAVPMASDLDEDSMQFNYQWSINDEEIPVYSAVLPGDRFKRGDRVSVRVTPSDNDSAGTPVISKAIVVPNAPPRIVSVPPADFRAEIYSYQCRAEDPDSEELIFSITSGPQGMIIDPRTGMVSLKINKEHAGTHQVEITAQDQQGLKDTQKYTLTLSIP